jgi:very-short-patch-repair endonuclease
VTIADDLDEQGRLTEVYVRLRLKLLDLSKKNRMLNYNLGSRSKRHLQIVDEVMDEIYKKLAGDDATLRIEPLDEPEDVPPEEKTEEFIGALEHAKVLHLEYLTKLEALESAGRDDELALAKLERELRDHIRSEFGLPPRPKKAEINRADLARHAGIDPNFELSPVKTKASHSDGALQTLKFPDELDRIMGKIVADAKLAEQEMGISTLFLSFGFLEWYESDASDKKAFAPLLLLPVTVDVKKQYGKNTYSLSASEGSAESNLSLQKLLETNAAFHRKLPAFENGDEEKVGSIEGYFDGVREAIKGLGRWQIHRWMVLGHFAFGRFAVYADLSPDNWTVDPVDHPLVGSILRGSDRTKDTGDGALLPGDPADYAIDDPQIEALAPFLIQDADASQHSALIDAMKGHNLVIHGPPGTGKSQTIANIIANGLAANKTILFVAEKQAALEVVKRRLAKAGIGEFCLELHSDKASPKAVLESIEERLKVRPIAVPAAPGRSQHENRVEIARYLDALHAVQASGRTPFDLIWQALRGSTLNHGAVESLSGVRLPPELLNSAANLSQVEADLDRFAGASETFLRSFGHPAESLWSKSGLSNVQSAQIDDLLACLVKIDGSARTLSSCIAAHSDFEIGSIADLRTAVKAGESLADRPVPELVGAVSHLDPDELTGALNSQRKLDDVVRALAACPSIGPQSTEVFRSAVELGKMPLPEIYFENNPADLLRIANETVENDLLLKNAITEFLPVLELFRLDGTCPATSLDAVAKAVIASAKISQEHRSALYMNQSVNVATFGPLRERWMSLLAKEREWREYLSAYGREQWPAPASLRSASALLKKGNVGRAFAAISGAAKPVNELVTRLGLTDSDKPAEDLAALAGHVDAIDAFEADDGAERVLGTSWLGLDTRFDLIDFGIKVRRYLRDQVGPDLMLRLLQIPQESVRRLHSFEASATNLRKIISVRTARLDDRSVDLTMTRLDNQLALMRRVVAVEGVGALAGFEIPIRELVEISKLELDRGRIRAVLDASPLKVAAEHFASIPDGQAKAVAALEWLRAVKAVGMPENLLRRLSSPTAADEFARLKSLANQASGPLALYESQVELLSSQFGAAAYARSEPAIVSEAVAALLERKEELRELLALYRERRILESLGLSEFLDCADRERIEPMHLPQLLVALLARRGAEFAKKAASALQDNTGSSLEVRRKQFAEKDRSKIKDDRLRIKANLLTKKPFPGSDFGKKKTWTEMALLDHEIAKQKRFVPVRTLLAQAGKSIQALKPCFMMSPLSLAKFMKAGSLSFDILVIDEASQMRPEDALGAMLRSKQIVVVGDQKQLPPTDFFARSGDAGTGDDDDFEDLDDESILESCQKTFGQRRPLRWHYRSRCESLIRFSNEQFYRRELITFPASKPASFSIDLVRIQGTFQARCNPTEASRVAEEAITFMRHHAAITEDEIPSLGIVALNIQQMELIQQELNRLMDNDVLVEQYCEKVLNKGEELFVKNLENVQGDERDFIFISMTYGPEVGTSVLKQRFGPINRKQGHRRLNVLFSRARTRVGLFCSFGSIDVVPTPESSEGVHVLRKYLEYAETRGRVSILPGAGADADSDFEIEVADRLRARGYVIDYQVGVSGYKIDLGVRHPDHPERYLAGVECDGATYHRSKSARDRDRLREEVLNDKGWDIVRVWSTDWFDNPALQTTRLLEKLEVLRRKPAVERSQYTIVTEATQPVGEAEAAEPMGGSADVDEPATDDATAPEAGGEEKPAQPETDAGLLEKSSLTESECFEALRQFRDRVVGNEMTDWEPHRSILRDAMIETFVRQMFVEPDDWFDKVPGYLRQGTNPIEKTRYIDRICDIVARLNDRENVATRADHRVSPDLFDGLPEARQGSLSPSPGGQSSTPHGGSSNRDEYDATNFSLLGLRLDPARFYDREYEAVLNSMVALTLKHEAPIYEDVLVARIARAHGFQRSGDRIQRAVSRIVGRKYRKTQDDGRTVIWGENSPETVLVPYRKGQSEVRSHTDTPVAELASLALPYIRVRLSDDDILYKMASHFQLGRLREPTRVRFQSAINLARQSLTNGVARI